MYLCSTIQTRAIQTALLYMCVRITNLILLENVFMFRKIIFSGILMITTCYFNLNLNAPNIQYNTQMLEVEAKSCLTGHSHVMLTPSEHVISTDPYCSDPSSQKSSILPCLMC